MTQEALTSFFGWMTVVNLGFLGLSTLMMIFMKNWVATVHGNLLGVERQAALNAIYVWLGNYKIAALVLCVAPYVALRLI